MSESETVRKARQMGATNPAGGGYRRASEVRAGQFDNSQPFEQFIGQELAIFGYEDRVSQFGQGQTYMVISAETMDGTKVAVRSSSNLVRRRLVDMKAELPLVFKLVQRGRSHDLE